LNKSNGAYPRIERERERERERAKQKKRKLEERSKEKMIGEPQEDVEKRGTIPILPLAVAFGIVASARASLSLSFS